MSMLNGNTVEMHSQKELYVQDVDLAKGNATERDFIALIDDRNLERECFVRSIELLHPRLTVLGFSSAEAFLKMASISNSARAIAVLLNVGSKLLPHPKVDEELNLLLNAPNSAPVVVLGPSDELEHMLTTLEAGAAGYIPANIGIDGIIDATRLAASGGVFLKLESLVKLRGLARVKGNISEVFKELTSRQTAVAEALRRGKANKVIAYELNMCESTVKVHIRSIMRKLRAHNRTEAAFKLNAILSKEPEVQD
ncbi:response regulator transcription factor (plasmid) [Paracoccus liaowanqingii]|uniref:Response regulator transcription factor n=1 Tax=Paracoccus liaowanqingii TaxID=2560053 RepID=A0A4Y5SS72_9RHOB|nr:response regulator transcription factor [Paracoccus liaowanqingii]QDA35808.1 response regulator transcription factor [Paracoccus liaowanqingii]